MIFIFNRIFGSKARERLESFQIETDNFWDAIKLIKEKQSQDWVKAWEPGAEPNSPIKDELFGDNLFLTWQGINGKSYFDNFFFNQLDTNRMQVKLSKSETEQGSCLDKAEEEQKCPIKSE